MSKKRILVVDDEPDVVSMMKRVLEEEGFEVEEAYDGDEALERVTANPPDAILLDVMMPGTDGYGVCARLKQDEQYADIPIIMLTSVASQVSSTRYSHHDGMTMEANDYIPKPATDETIIKSVRQALKL